MLPPPPRPPSAAASAARAAAVSGTSRNPTGATQMLVPTASMSSLSSPLGPAPVLPGRTSGRQGSTALRGSDGRPSCGGSTNVGCQLWPAASSCSSLSSKSPGAERQDGYSADVMTAAHLRLRHPPPRPAARRPASLPLTAEGWRSHRTAPPLLPESVVRVSDQPMGAKLGRAVSNLTTRNGPGPAAELDRMPAITSALSMPQSSHN